MLRALNLYSRVNKPAIIIIESRDVSAVDFKPFCAQIGNMLALLCTCRLRTFDLRTFVSREEKTLLPVRVVGLRLDGNRCCHAMIDRVPLRGRRKG